MILICTNELAGQTGYHKSVVELANGLRKAGYPIAILSFLGPGDGSSRMLPLWPLAPDVPAFALQSLPANGGQLLHRNYHSAFAGTLGSLRYSFTANELAALRQLNASLSPEDTVIFTSPIQTVAFKHAIGADERRPRTTLQIHGDYLHHTELWDLLASSREVVDTLQTVAGGLRAQFIPTFAESDVVFIPNYPGDDGSTITKVQHDGVNIVLPASFQHRKNQVDAVRALALIDDPDVHLTLWGNVNRMNPYVVALTQLIEDLELTERVHMPGFGTEADVYSTADIVLMTSLSEGFGYPLIEAAHHRLPAVAYDFEFGPRDAIEDGRSGFIVPLGNVDELAARLRELAGDASLRARCGARAFEVYHERFANEAVSEQHRKVLGVDQTAIDLVATFATVGREPVTLESISHETHRVGTWLVHVVTVDSDVELFDVQIDNGQRVLSPKVQHSGGKTRIEVRAAGVEDVSYATAPGSADRHYLANTNGRGVEVLPYLRRDADYGAGSPPVRDTVFATSGGARRLATREYADAIGSMTKNAPRDVLWKIRQLSASTKAPPKPAAIPGETSPAPSAQAGPAGIGRAAGVPGATLGSLSKMAVSLAKTAAVSGFTRLATVRGMPTRREIPRHPLFPITSGEDNFGTPVNSPGGVTVQNAGSIHSPSVSIRGEYDWLVLRDAVSERRVSPPFSYGEMFDRICAAEREHGLFDITTDDGVHLWELGRAALIIQLTEAFGMWSAAPPVGTPVQDLYDGPKRLTSAGPAQRVVFDYSRRGGSDYRTAAFRGDSTMFIVQPEPAGYPEVTDTNNVFPLHEFNQYRLGARRRWAQVRMPEIDARPFEAALADALGVRVDLGTHLRSRLLTFLDQREFWTPVFERVKPEEVLISSSHWWAGVSVAAQRAGALVADIQYAETGMHHPTFWFGDTPRYGASRLYAWSEFWAQRTNGYKEHVIVPRQQPELTAAATRDAGDPVWDVCIISQPRVLRRILRFVQELVRQRPGLKVVIAPHPVQRPVMAAELAAAGLSDAVAISDQDTLTTSQLAAVCVGGYSTSLWEAAAVGRPTYVIPLPGYELTLPDIESGLFRLASSPADLVPYEVPESRHDIFGTP